MLNPTKSAVCLRECALFIFVIFDSSDTLLFIRKGESGNTNTDPY